LSSKPPKSAESAIKPPAPSIKPVAVLGSKPPTVAGGVVPKKEESNRTPSLSVQPPKPQEKTKALEVAPGAELNGYIIESQIAKGAMGEIWRAKNLKIGKLAAIKVPSFELVARKDAAERFLQEARAVNEIRHRNIVDIFSFGTLLDGRPYFIMEFLEGKPLHLHLREIGPLPFPEIIEIFTQVCQALQAAHEAKIVHRDLKSENIFLLFDKKGRAFVKVLDFGIAKLKGALERPGQSLTMEGAVYGTPSYMSPEQCQGAKNVDLRADIYSLACVLYEMLTGRLPFREPEGNTGMLLVKHIAMRPFAPSRVVEGRVIPQQIDQLLLQALSKDPNARPQSCDAFAEMLTAAAREHREETREDLKNAKPIVTLEPSEMGPTQALAPMEPPKPKTEEVAPPTQKSKEPEGVELQPKEPVSERPAPPPPPVQTARPGKSISRTDVTAPAINIERTPPSRTALTNPEIDLLEDVDSKTDMITPEVAGVLQEKAPKSPAKKSWPVYAGGAAAVLLGVWLAWPAPQETTMPAITPRQLPVSIPVIEPTPQSEPAVVTPPSEPFIAKVQLFQLNTTPNNAQVFLNGELLGVTPLQKEISPIVVGDVLRIVKSGYETIELKLNPDKGIPASLFLVKRAAKTNTLPPNPFKKK
jgi:serine/threonine protein kinase